MSLEIDSIGGACPCQAEGTMDGNPFYFRARHGEWDLTVVPPGHDPVGSFGGNDVALFHEVGDDPHEGWMPIEEATAIIQSAYARWFA